jgi:hypothetical protein
MTPPIKQSRWAAGSLGFDPGRPDHLAPFLSFVGDQLVEVGGRAWERGDAQLSEPRLHLSIGERRIDLLVELVNNLSPRVFRRADASPETRLVAWHEFGILAIRLLRRQAVGDGPERRGRVPSLSSC